MAHRRSQRIARRPEDLDEARKQVGMSLSGLNRQTAVAGPPSHKGVHTRMRAMDKMIAGWTHSDLMRAAHDSPNLVSCPIEACPTCARARHAAHATWVEAVRLGGEEE